MTLNLDLEKVVPYIMMDALWTLAIREKFQIKGFIPADPLVSNIKNGCKKATRLDGFPANLTSNKNTQLRRTYKRK